MANQYIWIIDKLDVSPSYNLLNNVVRTVHWRMKATDGENETELYGNIRLGEPTSDSYVQYDTLTQETVITWIEQNFDVANLKLKMDRTLERMATPVIVSMDPPWKQIV